MMLEADAVGLRKVLAVVGCLFRVAFDVGRLPVLVGIVSRHGPRDDVFHLPVLPDAVDFPPAQMAYAAVDGEQPGAFLAADVPALRGGIVKGRGGQ